MFGNNNNMWQKSHGKKQQLPNRANRFQRSKAELEQEISDLHDELFTLDTVAGLAEALSEKVQTATFQVQQMYVAI